MGCDIINLLSKQQCCGEPSSTVLQPPNAFFNVTCGEIKNAAQGANCWAPTSLGAILYLPTYQCSFGYFGAVVTLLNYLTGASNCRSTSALVELILGVYPCLVGTTIGNTLSSLCPQ